MQNISNLHECAPLSITRDTRLAKGRALIPVSFNPIQEVEPGVGSLVPRLLPRFLTHTVGDKKLGRILGTTLGCGRSFEGGRKSTRYIVFDQLSWTKRLAQVEPLTIAMEGWYAC